jgi:hypothetical protein
MPRIQESPTPVSREDVFLATDPTRWEFIVEAMRHAFPATAALEIARRSPTFRGGDTAARHHAERLANARILERHKNGGRVTYEVGAKGRAIYARMSQLQLARPFRTTSESRLLCLVARLGDRDYDAFDLAEPLDLELLTELRSRVADARRHIRIVEV